MDNGVHRINDKTRCMGVIDQVCPVKMMDIGQVLFLFYVFMDGVDVHKHAQNERGQCATILTEQAWLRICYMKKRTLFPSCLELPLGQVKVAFYNHKPLF